MLLEGQSCVALERCEVRFIVFQKSCLHYHVLFRKASNFTLSYFGMEILKVASAILWLALGLRSFLGLDQGWSKADALSEVVG